MQNLVRTLTLITCVFGPVSAHASGGHGHGTGADLTVVVDGGGDLEIEYPFASRPTIRVTPDALPGLFSSTSPGFIPGEGDGVSEFELAVPTTLELELVRTDGDVSYFQNGDLISLPGETALIGTHSCQIDVDSICENGDNDGTVCSDDLDCTGGGTCTGVCEPDASNLHQHGEFFLSLMTPDHNTFAEGAITFRLNEVSANGYGSSEEYTLKLSNGPLPALEPADLDEAKAVHKCRQSVAKEVRSVGSKQYQLISKCLDAIFAAEELGKSEKSAVKACAIDSPECSGGSNDGNFCSASKDCPGGICVGNTKSLVANINKLTEKVVAKLDKACDKSTPGSFGPFTESNIRTHIGMVGCRTQELVGATYAESVAEMTEILGECHDGLCVAGPNSGGACEESRCDGGANDGLACGDDVDCPGGDCDAADDCDAEEVEEAIEAAFPCLKMTQAQE